MDIKQKKILLEIARSAIENYLKNRVKRYPTRAEIDDPKLWEERATFVTLTIDGELKGCIGSIIPTKPLIMDVVDNAINAAFRDPRFFPLREEELDKIEIEISILTIPQRLEFVDYKDLFEKIKPGIHGVILRKGYYQATFLPQVWGELPTHEEFFSHLCLKAGLSPSCFKERSIEVEVYEVEAFSEKEISDKGQMGTNKGL